MMIAKISSRTKEQKERKEKDPRRAQLEAKLVNPVSLTIFFLILAVSIVIGVVLGTTTELSLKNSPKNNSVKFAFFATF